MYVSIPLSLAKNNSVTVIGILSDDVKLLLNFSIVERKKKAVKRKFNPHVCLNKYVLAEKRKTFVKFEHPITA